MSFAPGTGTLECQAVGPSAASVTRAPHPPGSTEGFCSLSSPRSQTLLQRSHFLAGYARRPRLQPFIITTLLQGINSRPKQRRCPLCVRSILTDVAGHSSVNTRYRAGASLRGSPSKKRCVNRVVNFPVGRSEERRRTPFCPDQQGVHESVRQPVRVGLETTHAPHHTVRHPCL